jgi:L-ascorbate metabolism protein UlaG (beta-lactamase superfamily)
MEITHLGHSSFKIRGKSATVVTDPFSPEMVGLKFPKVEANIVTVSHRHEDHDSVANVLGTPIVVNGPGEYEISGVKIIGVGTYHDEMQGAKRGRNTIYHIEMDGLSIVHTGDLGHKLEEKEMELLGGVDILLVAVGGVVTIGPQEAAYLVSKLEPAIIIPMHYKEKKGNQAFYADLAPIDDFLKEMGKGSVTPIPKLNITKDKLPTEPMIVVLE